jgi:branched-chain amino acid transport system permease protein
MMNSSRAVQLAVVVLALGLLPSMLPSYGLVLATRILIFAILAMSLDLLVGYTGLSSLGHAAFLGVGGYAVGLLSRTAANTVWLALPMAILASLLLAALFGLLVLRSRGVYFMMLTLALAQVVWGIAFSWRSVTGGDDGLPGISRPMVGSIVLDSSESFYLFVLIIFVISAAILLLIVNSPFGLSLEGIRESAPRMSALGYNVWLHQYLAFIMAGGFAGAAGALLAYQNGIITPSSLSIPTGAEALLMVLLGGAGTMIGPFVGAICVVVLEFVVSAHTERWEAVLGIIYIVVVIGAPDGIYPPLRGAFSRVLRRATTRTSSIA